MNTLPACKYWTDSELELLRSNFSDSRTDDLARALGRSYSTVAQKAAKLGLHKSEAYLNSPDAHRLDGLKGMGTRFHAGQESWNKGKPGSCGLHENSRAHHYKPGNVSGRAAQLVQPIGSLRINTDGCLDRKVSELPGPNNLRWHPVHRLVWEAAHGKVPEGHVVCFRPGKKTTDIDKITVDVLELLTRAENMRRNSVHSRYPPELARLVQLRGALSRQINRKAKEAEQA